MEMSRQYKLKEDEGILQKVHESYILLIRTHLPLDFGLGGSDSGLSITKEGHNYQIVAPN